MSDELSRPSIIDEEHLKLLSLGYMISPGTTAFFSLFGLVYAVMGIVISKFPSQQQGVGTSGTQAAPALIGWIFAGNRDRDIPPHGHFGCRQTSDGLLHQAP